MSLEWFRRWYALAVVLRLPRKRAFLRAVMSVDYALLPFWNLLWRIKNPAMHLRVRRLQKLMRMGRWEIGA